LINRDPYGAGWIMRVKPAGGAATETLDAKAYEAVAAAGG
jgi:glycine cleavage system H lipoate-binding protein